jgi:hypothetical protein
MSHQSVSKLGFTGTREGLTRRQIERLIRVLTVFKPSEVHHGDCIGGDSDFHTIVRSLLFWTRIIGHPPEDSSRRAHCIFDRELPPRPYLDRNHDIVDAVEMLVVCPKEMEEIVRSGTWATYRYARKWHKSTILILPEEPR